MCLAHELGIAGFNPRKIATTATISMQATAGIAGSLKAGGNSSTPRWKAMGSLRASEKPPSAQP
jgi:hypothetical protein